MKNKNGFTLIELLVVISIISLLASIVLASLNSARVKARDARRIADLGQIRTALEFFFDTNGFYPQSDCGWDCNGYRYSYNSGWDTLATDMRPYINTMPKDPLNSPASPPWSIGGFTYAYGNVGRTTLRVQYDLTAQLEDTNNPLRCGVKLYKFYFDNQPWCSAASDTSPYPRQIYEASVN